MRKQPRALFINVHAGVGSTGRICLEQALQYEKDGYDVRIAYGRDQCVSQDFLPKLYKIGTSLDFRLHALATRLCDAHGFCSRSATKKFLIWADKFDPDLLWLHNIHGYYLNVEMLFNWIKSRPQMKVYWTLHDGWAFTGHCACFNAVGCEKWKTRCYDCVQKKEYPSSLILDNSTRNYKRKKTAFTGVNDMTLITPSGWLADRVSQSFLKEYPTEVHYNTVDKNIFKPTPGNFREEYGLQNKIIILGVANVWQECKGLYDFIALSKMLPDEYVIILVGVSAEQRKMLPKNIIGISRTNSTKELAMIYSTSDIFANPSKEETFGLTTLEAACCGTSTVVYKGTACEEIAEKIGGLSIEPNVNALYQAILSFSTEKISAKEGLQ